MGFPLHMGRKVNSLHLHSLFISLLIISLFYQPVGIQKGMFTLLRFLVFGRLFVSLFLGFGAVSRFSAGVFCVFFFFLLLSARALFMAEASVSFRSKDCLSDVVALWDESGYRLVL